MIRLTQYLIKNKIAFSQVDNHLIVDGVAIYHNGKEYEILANGMDETMKCNFEMISEMLIC